MDSNNWAILSKIRDKIKIALKPDTKWPGGGSQKAKTAALTSAIEMIDSLIGSAPPSQDDPDYERKYDAWATLQAHGDGPGPGELGYAQEIAKAMGDE
jgi:hypothetical protein